MLWKSKNPVPDSLSSGFEFAVVPPLIVSAPVRVPPVNARLPVAVPINPEEATMYLPPKSPSAVRRTALLFAPVSYVSAGAVPEEPVPKLTLPPCQIMLPLT